MDTLPALILPVSSPISRESINEKVELFERRLNGKILPFVGLHGTLMALLYLVGENTNSISWRLYLAAVALFCGFLTAVYSHVGRARDSAGGSAMAVCFGLVAVLLPSDGAPALQLAAAVGLCLAFLALNRFGWVHDYEFNTVWLYLPLIFFIVNWPSGMEQMLVALALYAPAIYVKFRVQSASNKVPLGVSVLVFLGLIIHDNAQSEGLIAALVLLVLVLFTVYSFRMRRITASSYRHFLADAIIMGLWALLVILMDLSSDSISLVVWGIGVAVFQSVGLLVRLHKFADAGKLGANARTDRDARLVWLQIATWAMFSELIITGVLEQHFGVEQSYVGTLIIIAPFILLFRWLQAPLLALSTRLWIAGCLLAAAVGTMDHLQQDYAESDAGKSLETFRAALVDDWFSEFSWLLFALAVALAATVRVTPDQVAWWRGMIRARHVALVRRSTRLVFDNANRIAFVGGFVSALVALSNWMNYAGGKGQRSRDALLIGAHVYAVVITVLFGRYWVGCCDAQVYPALTVSPLTFASGDLPFVLACCVWGTLLYLYGVFARDYLARFFSTAFAVMPLATFAANNSFSDSTFLAQVVLACCLALFGFGLLRRVAG